MNHSHAAPSIEPSNCRLDTMAPRLLTFGSISAVVGFVCAIGAGIAAGDQFTRFAHSYLVGYVFSLGILLGVLLFVLLQHLTKSGWFSAIRRIPEILAALIPVWCLLALPIVFVLPKLDPWAAADPGSHLEHTGLKAIYLQPVPFVVRFAIYCIIWSWLGRIYFRRSLDQDKTGGIEATRFLERLSPIGTILWALTASLFSFDAIMSLDAHWYSTMFGVYFFSGCMVGAMSTIILIVWFLQSSGHLPGAVTKEHYHDLGKLLFAFTMFWAYIAFSQYLLIWYSNIPEETGWFAKRVHGPWAGVGWLLIFGHFVVPYLAIMSRHMKRQPRLLAFWALWQLLMHYVDIWWQVVPPISPDHLSLTISDIGCAVGFMGCIVAGFAIVGRHLPLINERDPRFMESLSHVSP
ncbi:quinol:cytochrome C oxidoreductase [Candidatus Sumerlaeota bacterium]|nr:quinol:cytochrome C oxidoreductase [Candidatus Sumerlaeota bacterium]